MVKAVRADKLDIGEVSHTSASAMSLSEKITMLRKQRTGELPGKFHFIAGA